jgi:hypothetical protein
MRFVIPLAVIAGLGAAGIASAETSAIEPRVNAQARAISPADLRAKLEKLGYDVHRVKAGEQHYEADLVERTSGGAVRAMFDKSSGELVGAKLAQDDDQARDRKETRDDREAREPNEARERKGKSDRERSEHPRRDAR